MNYSPIILESIATGHHVSNVTILSPPEMSLMLATEGDSDNNVTHTPSQQCVEGNGAGGQAYNNGKPTTIGEAAKK